MTDHVEWTTAFINDLPDSAFAWIEPGGKKDDRGKTVPRTYRHLPYKDPTGKVDLPHVRNALARMGQVKDKDGKSISQTTQGRIKKMLQDILTIDKEMAEFGKQSLSKCMDCSKPPEVEVLWADGRGRIWMCVEDFIECLQSEDGDKGTDIVSLHYIDGKADAKWDSSKANSWDTFKKRPDIKKILASQKDYEEHAVAKPFGHPAGQMLQARRIISLIPEHSIFVEPFAGSATIFFSKDPTDGDEILNDLNKNYVKALKTLKSLKDDEIKELTKKNWTGSRAYYNRIKKMTPPSDKVGWLHWFLYKTTFSFGSLGKSFDTSDEGHTKTLNQARRYEKIRDRMKNAHIISMDWAECIKQNDSPETFFYIDPPYYTAKDKRAAAFKIGEVDLKHFVDILGSIKGKFIASIGDEPDWINALKDAGFHIQKIQSPRSIPSLKKGAIKTTASWPLVSNFPMKIESLYEDSILDEILNFELQEYDTSSLPSRRLPYNTAHPVIDSVELQEILILQVVEQEALKKGYINSDEDKSGSIIPFEFIKPLISTPAYLDNDVYNLRGLVEMATRLKSFYPAIVHENFDGIRIQIHKHGKKVCIYSGNDVDISEKFPSIVKEVKSMKVDTAILDAGITGWEDGYKKGKFYGRNHIKDYIIEKSQTNNNDILYYANVFDILYIDTPTYESKISMDLHNTPTYQRMEFLEGIFKNHNQDRLRLAEIKNINNSTELIESAKYFSRDKGSDGAIFKAMDSIYQLNGSSKLWLGYVQEMDLNAQVIQIRKVKNMENTFRYLTAVRTPGGKPIVSGMTLNTSIRANKGDIIRVAFTDIDMFTQTNTKDNWFSVNNGRVVGILKGRPVPDTSITAERFSTATKGEIESKEMPVTYLDALKESMDYQQILKFTWQKRTLEGKDPDYHLSIDFPQEPGLRHFHITECPLEKNSVRAIYAPMTDKKMMTLSGDVPPESRFNPDKVPAHYKLVEEKQPVEIMEWTKDGVIFNFGGKVIKGLWSFVRKDGNEWDMIQEVGEITKCEAEHSTIFMEFDIRSHKPYEGNPNFLEISGLYFHRGTHKGNTYLDEHLKKINMKPRPGKSLTFTNWYHNKTDYYQAGIMLDLWWDSDVQWIDKANSEHGVGGVMYRSVITDPKAINEILTKQIKNHSAELNFNSYYVAGVKHVKDIDGIGQGLTSYPALMAADIGEICTIDQKSGERTCD